MVELSAKSKAKLAGVHADLVRVVELAATMASEPFVVHEGLRSVERQRKLVNAGKSQTMRSRHITGHAVDLWCIGDNGKVIWDSARYRRLADLVTRAAEILKVSVEWGGNWKTFKDGPHFQLPKALYPG